MDTHKHIEVLEALANGIDPITGEILPNQSPYNHPEIIRSIFQVVDHLKNPLRKAKKPKKTLEEKRAENLEKGLPRNAGISWNDQERQELKNSFASQCSIGEIALKHERTTGAIRSELKKLGLLEE